MLLTCWQNSSQNQLLGVLMATNIFACRRDWRLPWSAFWDLLHFGGDETREAISNAFFWAQILTLFCLSYWCYHSRPMVLLGSFLDRKLFQRHADSLMMWSENDFSSFLFWPFHCQLARSYNALSKVDILPLLYTDKFVLIKNFLGELSVSLISKLLKRVCFTLTTQPINRLAFRDMMVDGVILPAV